MTDLDEEASVARTLALHGHEVHYRMAGEGETVLLIHGMAGSSRTWRAVLPKLARSYRVIAPDLLGHGESAKPLGDYSLGAHASGLRDVLGALGVERATLVGQSLGGGVAMQLAYQHPEVCERLALVSSGGLGREVSWILRALTLPGAELVMPVLFPSFVRDSGNAFSRFVARLGWRAPHIAEMWRAYASLAEPENRHAFVRTLRAVIDPGGQSVSATDRLYLAGAVPTLIMWGDSDPIIPVEHAYRAHELMPGSRLEILEGVGHFPHVEVPDRFVELLTAFIDETEPAVPDPGRYRRLLTNG
jgi:pimeloyl-ACP methyl ester carboxylesterase